MHFRRPVGLAVVGVLGSLFFWRCAPTVNLPSSNSASICSGTTVRGVSGTAICLPSAKLLISSIFRSVGTSQITQAQEVTTFAGSAGNSLPTGFREIPYIENDDEGFCNADAVSAGTCTLAGNAYVTTPVISITWAQHVNIPAGGGLVNCGMSKPTIQDRITDCATQNQATGLATWNGATNANSGEGIWKLVTRNTAQGTCSATVNSCRPVEVWKDQRTGLLWSSLVAGSSASSGGGQAADNWCLASGNSQSTSVTSGLPWPSTDPKGYCSGANQNQTSPTSYCAESALFGPSLSPALATENWTTGIYDLAKGGMGALASTTSPSVRWRLPTLHDYYLAEIDGIRFVMPDMGGMTTNLFEWSSTIYSAGRDTAQVFGSEVAGGGGNTRNGNEAARCLGR
jgi:hypothetical protein